MEEDFFSSAYKGSKNFSQHDVKTANATGFGAAADDYAERGIDLNEELIKNKPATFFLRVKGKAMEADGIFENDVLIVDRSINPTSGKIIAAALQDEFIVRRLKIQDGKTFLSAPKKSPVEITPEMNYRFWGVVTYIIHKV